MLKTLFSRALHTFRACIENTFVLHKKRLEGIKNFTGNHWSLMRYKLENAIIELEDIRKKFIVDELKALDR